MDYQTVHNIFYYKNGNLYWRDNRGTQKTKDKIAGSIGIDGRQTVIVNKKRQKVHRIIFLLCNKYLPKFVDHIDGNPLNNHIENLRECTKSQNSQNMRYKINKSGVKAVNWHKKAKSWHVRIWVNKKRMSFGYFKDIELAELVAAEARNKYHNNFARTI